MLFKSMLAGALLAALATMPAKAESGGLAQLYRDAIAAAVNGGDLAAADRFFSASFVDHAPWPGQPATVEGFKAGLADFRTSFPDLQFKIMRTVEQGDMLVAHFQISGSQLGPFMGKSATGRTFTIEAVDILRFDGGKAVEHWGVIDMATMAEQLGL